MAIFRRNSTPVPTAAPVEGIQRGDRVSGEAPTPAPIPAPVNQVAPSITGTLTKGSTLTGVVGQWVGASSFTYQWLRDDVAISGAVNITYVPTDSDVDATLKFRVTATNSTGTATATSTGSVIEDTVEILPTVVTPPTIGTQSSYVPGVTLTATAGTYSDEDSVSKEWLRDGSPISGETGLTYTLQTGDIGFTIAYRETAINTAGSVISTTDAITVTEPASDGPLLTFNLSAQPSTVGITRQGANATYRDNNGDLQVAIQNFPRYHHDTNGTFIGLYVEKAKTNLSSFNTAMGTSPPWSVGAGATVTLNAAVGPTGATDATRLQVAAGNILKGISRTITGTTSGQLRYSIYMRSRSGSTRQVYVRDPATGHIHLNVPTTWTRFDLVANNAGTTVYNEFVLCPDNDAMDIEIWGEDVTVAGTVDDSIIISGASATTRNAETLTLGMSGLTGLVDVRFTFSDNSTQDFSSQSITGSGTLVFQAQNLNKSLVKQIDIYTLGTIPGASEPPPAPPPPSGLPAGTPLIHIDDLVAWMTTDSLGRPKHGHSRNRWASGYAAHYDQVKAIIDASIAAGHSFPYRFDTYYNEILPWFWVYAGVDHNDSLLLRLQYRNGITSFRDKNTGVWTHSTVKPGTSFDGYMWNGNNQWDPLTDLTETSDWQNHSDGSRSSRFTGYNGCELWWTPAVVDRSLVVNADTIALACECRIVDQFGNPYYGSGGQYALHLGFDAWGRDAPGTQYYHEGTAQGGRYWANGANGWNNNWTYITNGDWKTVAMVVMEPYNQSPGNAHTGDYTADFPWCKSPFVPTEANIRANPPTWAYDDE